MGSEAICRHIMLHHGARVMRLLVKMAAKHLAFVNENPEQAMEVCQMDDTADDLNLRILKDRLSLLSHLQ